jgi:hypothetical protein
MRKVLVFTLFLLLLAGTANATWMYWYTVDVQARVRGIAIAAEDDFSAGDRAARMSWYHNAPQYPHDYPPYGANCWDLVWDCPFHAGESIPITWNWGLGIDGDDNVYLINQDWTGTDGSSVLVWDYNCQEVDRMETDIDPSGTEYGSALDVDGNGYVYIGFYLTATDVRIYNPMPWGADGDHNETPLASSFDAGAYVTEGVCVNQAGTVIYVTNRSAPGTQGWCRRFTGSVAGGFTQDMAFGVSGDLPVMGYVRGVDLDEVDNRIFVCSDNNVKEYILIANATTGAIIETLFTDPGLPYHVSPYDVEYDPVGHDLYIAHYYGWYVAKWHEQGTPWAVTMSSFEATAGQEQVELTWRVDSEIDNQGFNIYRDNKMVAVVPSQGATETPRTYTWIDRDVVAGVTYAYRIADVSLDGAETMHDFVATATPLTSSGMPTTYWLSQNYPNPFNADTHIEFRLAEAGHTTLKIYNTTGQLVRTLVDRDMTASQHKVLWNGRNESGQMVSSGIYFYRLASGKFAETKKMSFLR